MALNTGARKPTHAARILVVDDDTKLLGFVCRALVLEGFLVDKAAGGERALELLEERQYELVVLDLLMQDVDGFAVLERAMQSQPRLPVVVLSGVSDVQSKVRCFQLGAADYLTKPFALAELVARIRARLRSPVGAGEVTLRSNGFKLDLRRKLVLTADGTVRLSDREFLLLQHLIRNEGEVCSRAELLEEVWNYSFDPGTNVVDVYVGRLRAKLGSAAIETVRNSGYCIPGE